MSALAAGQTRLVVVGATGMVGGYALRYALDHPSVEVVTVIGRKKLGISHPKLKEVVHKDFADCSGLARPLSDGPCAAASFSDDSSGPAFTKPLPSSLTQLPHQLRGS
jgi:Semialdehyde dehydrogenase, NAD binding domain